MGLNLEEENYIFQLVSSLLSNSFGGRENMPRNVIFSDLDKNSAYDFSELIPAILNNYPKIYVNFANLSYLYLYRGEQDFIPDIIKNETIYFSPAANFNDPADSSITYILYKNAVRHVNSHIKEEQLRLKYRIISTHLKKNTVISCLTETPQSTHMWKKYGCDFRGICIQYDIYKYFKLQNGNSRPLLPVIYTNEKDKILEQCFDNEFLVIDPGVVNLLTLCKTKAWEKEQEWRFFDRSQNIKEPKGFHMFCPISKIYLGPNFDMNKHKDIILQEAHKKNIPTINCQRDAQDNIIIQD